MVAGDNHPIDSFESTDRHRHGRHEYRLVDTFDVEGHLKDGWDEHIKTVARVTRHTWRKNTKTGLWDQSSEIAFYASQIPLTAKTFGAVIRHHWGIENKNNYVRDVSFFEDQSRIRNKPALLARLRTFALNILRANDTKNVSQELFINALNPAHLMSYAVT